LTRREKPEPVNTLIAVLMAIGASAVVVYGTAIIGYFALKISRRR